MMLAIARTACQNHAYRICCPIFHSTCRLHVIALRGENGQFEGRKWSVSGGRMTTCEAAALRKEGEAQSFHPSGTLHAYGKR